jgi:hypothetical protein
VAYVARSGTDNLVVAEGKEGKRYGIYDYPLKPSITDLMFSPDSRHLAYIVQSADSQFVVVDDREGKEYKCPPMSLYCVADLGFVPSADGTQAVYWVTQGDKEFLVIGEKEQQKYATVDELKVTAKGSIVYKAQAGLEQFVVVDGKEGPKYDMVKELKLSPDGKRLAYRAARWGKWFDVIDGKVYKDQRPRKSSSPPAAAEAVEYAPVMSISLDKVFGTPEKWKATAYEAQVERLEDTDWPARLCFSNDQKKADQDCYEAQVTRARDGSIFGCQFVKHLSVLPLFKKEGPRRGVLFTAMASGGGSGSWDLISIWVYERETKKFRNILPQVGISEQGEFRVVSTLKPGLDNLFITADYIWRTGETHFAWHRYVIKIFQYDKETRLFGLVGEYATESKYKGLDDADMIDVIGPEMKNIRKYMSRKR